ncbi:MAG: hypothetical protein H7263_02065 [Candidatus Sericytochromatia bacterium]|nr:hypothetical protein [Candidatus Sericytochromatia bacterium]
MNIKVSDTNLALNIGVSTPKSNLAVDNTKNDNIGLQHSHEDKFKKPIHKTHKNNPIPKNTKIDFSNSSSESNTSKTEFHDVKLDAKTSIGLASTALSVIKIPAIEPVKIALSCLSTDSKKQDLSKEIENKNFEGVATNSIGFVQSTWGTTTSISSFVDTAAKVGVDLGLISSNVSSNVCKVTSSVSGIATKITIPFAVVGIGLSAWDIKKTQDIVNVQAKKVKNNHNTSNTKKLNNELYTVRANRNIKSVAFGLSVISTSALIYSIKKPNSAYIAAPVSLVAGISSSLVSVMSSPNLRVQVKYNLGVMKHIVTSKIRNQ